MLDSWFNDLYLNEADLTHAFLETPMLWSIIVSVLDDTLKAQC